VNAEGEREYSVVLDMEGLYAEQPKAPRQIAKL